MASSKSTALGIRRPGVFIIRRSVVLKKQRRRSRKARIAIKAPVREGKHYYCEIQTTAGLKVRLAGIEPLQAILNGLRFIVVDLSRLEEEGWSINSSDGKKKVHWRHYFDVNSLGKIRDQKTA